MSMHVKSNKSLPTGWGAYQLSTSSVLYCVNDVVLCRRIREVHGGQWTMDGSRPKPGFQI